MESRESQFLCLGLLTRQKVPSAKARFFISLIKFKTEPWWCEGPRLIKSWGSRIPLIPPGRNRYQLSFSPYIFPHLKILYYFDPNASEIPFKTGRATLCPSSFLVFNSFRNHPSFHFQFAIDVKFEPFCFGLRRTLWLTYILLFKNSFNLLFILYAVRLCTFYRFLKNFTIYFHRAINYMPF